MIIVSSMSFGGMKMLDESALAKEIWAVAKSSGFTECGIVRTDEMRGYLDALQKRIARFPESEPFYRRFTRFAVPDEIVPWVKSVVICVNWYGEYQMPEHFEGLIGKSYCFDERMDKLSKEYRGAKRFEVELEKMGVRFQAKRDFGITAMRWAAGKAGIGIIRKNNFFYTAKGSWCHLHAYLIDLDVELKNKSEIKKCSESCDLCMRACPTGALCEPFQTDGTKCISFLLCMNTVAPGKKHYDKCGAWIYGCDACQNACPFNKRALTGETEFPGLSELAAQISHEKILSMDYDTMRQLLPQKFWYINPEEVWKWKCNVLNALRNGREEKALPLMESALNDPQEEVRNMAKWAMQAIIDSPHETI